MNHADRVRERLAQSGSIRDPKSLFGLYHRMRECERAHQFRTVEVAPERRGVGQRGENSNTSATGGTCASV